MLLCSNMQKDAPSSAKAEPTYALFLASARRLPQQVATLVLPRDSWRGQSLIGHRQVICCYARIGKAVARYARAFGMEVCLVKVPEWKRARAVADLEAVAEIRGHTSSGLTFSVSLTIVASMVLPAAAQNVVSVDNTTSASKQFADFLLPNCTMKVLQECFPRSEMPLGKISITLEKPTEAPSAHKPKFASCIDKETGKTKTSKPFLVPTVTFKSGNGYGVDQVSLI